MADPLNRVPWRIEDVLPSMSWWPEAVLESMDSPEVPWWTPDEEEDDL
jgi:hypothetical protein